MGAKETRTRVLVLGEDERSFLAAIRSFGRAGFTVDAGWSTDLTSPALASSYIGERVELPFARPGDRTWLTALNGLVKERDYDFVLPCHDTQVAPLQGHRHDLALADRYALIPDHAFAIASDKGKTHTLARQLDVPVPEQRVARTPGELAAIGAELGYPLYVKPPCSVDPARPGVRREVIRLDGWRQIELLPAAELREGYVVQRAVSGRGVGVELLARDGRILVAFQHERLHEPPAGGGSSYRRSVPLDAQLLDYSARLIEALSYTGAGMVEFKVRDDRSLPYLMEINARLWGSLALTVSAGVNIPLWWYEMQRKQRIDFPRTYRSGVYCRNWSQERYWLSANLAARKAGNAGLITVSPYDFARELLNIPLGKEHSDTFAADDPLPWIREITEVARGLLTPRLYRTRVGQLLHQRSRRTRIVSARSMLFLCYGNICRSPLAERLARRLSGVTVSSAGTYPLGGRSSPEDAIIAAAAFDIDLTDHRSRVVTRAMLHDADVVFVFDDRNWQAALAVDPQCRRKLVYLGAYCTRSPPLVVAEARSLTISDPYNKGREAFLFCYRDIAGAIEAIAELRLRRRRN